MNITQEDVKKGNGGKLQGGFDEKALGVDGIAVLGGEEPRVIGKHLKASRQRLAATNNSSKQTTPIEAPKNP